MIETRGGWWWASVRSNTSFCPKLAGSVTRVWCLRCFFFSSRRRHTRLQGDWSSDVCSSDLIADFFDEELARWVAVMTRLIEPVLMIVIGLIIGVIVVLMYFPIFQLAGSIK